MPLDNNNLLAQLREHIVQIEALNIYIIFFLGTMFLASSIEAPKSIQVLLTCAMLAGTALVVRVTNPSSTLRDRFKWGTTLGGVGGALGTVLGAVVDLSTFGLTAGAGTLAGFALGGALGGGIGGRIEAWSNEKPFVERAEAFDFLYKYRHKQSRLANATLINGILDNQQTWDRTEDGRKWYEMESLKEQAHASEKKLARIREREFREPARQEERARQEEPARQEERARQEEPAREPARREQRTGSWPVPPRDDEAERIARRPWFGPVRPRNRRDP